MTIFASLLLAVLLGGVATATVAAETDERPALVLDGDTFVVFYDLPSRRFRALRRALTEGDEALFDRDRLVSVEYLSLEMQRMDVRLAGPMREVIGRLSGIDPANSAAAELDPIFSRAHWLLAQHFLLVAHTRLRETERPLPSNYLVATAHHLEWATLWSGAEITPKLAKTLDELRVSAADLRKTPDRSRYQRLIRRTASVLAEVSRTIDRPVRIELN